MFFIDNPQYFSFLFLQSGITIDLSKEANEEKNYKPFEIYKTLILSLLEKSDCPLEKPQDATISTWAFIHGIASLATMKNVCYDGKWEKQSLTSSIYKCF